jgi:hypothetical protein
MPAVTNGNLAGREPPTMCATASQLILQQAAKPAASPLQQCHQQHRLFHEHEVLAARFQVMEPSHPCLLHPRQQAQCTCNQAHL